MTGYQRETLQTEQGKRKRASERCCRLGYRKSKALKNEIEDLRCEISTHEETIEQLQDRIQTIQNDYSRELMQLEAKHRSELNRKETEHAQEQIVYKTLVLDIIKKKVCIDGERGTAHQKRV